MLRPRRFSWQVEGPGGDAPPGLVHEDPAPATRMSGRERSRSRDGSEEEECTLQMVEERLAYLQAEGYLDNDELDSSAQAMLRKSDPDIAMEALKQWQSSEMWTRKNPSACMTKLLKRLNAQGHEVAARRGALEDDEAAKEAVQELLEQLADKLDHSAREELDKLEPHQAYSILSDIDHQADIIRNPSAFVMSAVKRQGSTGSRNRREPPRLQEGPYADRSYDDRDSHSSRRRGSDRSNGYSRQDYDSRHSRRRDNESYHKGYSRSDFDRVEELLNYLDIDESAKEALSTIPPDSQVQLLEELREDYSRVRKHSAFIVSNVKRVKEGTYRPRQPKDEGDGYSQSNYRDQQSRGRRDRGYDYDDYGEARSSPQDSYAWSHIDEKAQGEILALSREDAVNVMSELESKIHGLRNASAFVSSIVKRYQRSGGQSQDTSGYDPPARSRSPRGGRHAIGAPAEGHRPSSNHATHYSDYADDREPLESAGPPASAEEAEQQRLQVADFLKNGLQGEIVLDHKAKDELLRIPPHEALNLMLKLTANDIRNPSAFVTKACREILKQLDSEPYARQAGKTNGHDRPSSKEQSQAARKPPAKAASKKEAQAAADQEATADWRSTPLDQWLRNVDHGKGFLLQYEQALQSNYDTLEQIMDLYVTASDDGKITIDQQFFSDLSVEKVGHKRLFEKWFKEQLEI